jgi:polar amino acid transport system permease protein
MIFHVPWSDYLPVLGTALLKTVELTIAGFLGACAFGLLLALSRLSRSRIASRAAQTVIEVFRNLPVVTGLFIVYFGLTTLQVTLTGFSAGVLCLSLFYGAYLAEIFRGGMQSIAPGQKEAAHALGFTGRGTFLSVELPQVIRVVLPSTTTIFIDLLKGTSLLVTIGGGELMTQATVITSDTYRPLEVYVVIGCIYLVLCFTLSRAAARLEQWLRDGRPLSLSSHRMRELARAHQARTQSARAAMPKEIAS